MYDIIITNGKIIDGSGKAAFIGDIAIQGGKIIHIGDCRGSKAQRIIDAAGRYVTPGFIDPHSHLDMNLMIYPEAKNYLYQGVTTAIGGNCAASQSLINDTYVFNIWEQEAVMKSRGMMFDIGSPFFARQEIMQIMKENYGFDMDWRNTKEYLAKAEKTGIGVNFCQLAGHNQIRVAVMGEDCQRTATDEEIEKMKEVLRSELDGGAFGMSSGLIYFPGLFCDTRELIALASVLKEYGAIYTSHIREFNIADPAYYDGLTGIEEIIKIAEESGVKTQLSHLFGAFAIKQQRNANINRASAHVTLKLLEDSIARGGDITFDVIPSIGGGIFLQSKLRSYAGPLFRLAGSLEQFQKNLNAPDFEAFALNMFEKMPDVFAINAMEKMGVVMVITITACKDKSFVGKTLNQIKAENGWNSMQAILHLLKLDINTSTRNDVGYIYAEHVEIFTQHPRAMIASDVTLCDENTVYIGEPDMYLPHPNAFCYAIKYLTLYPRPTIEETIRALTGFVAERFGIEKRGILAEGNFADIVIFDQEHLKTNENYVEPRTYPEGIDYVLVNGAVSVDNGKFTGVRAGKPVAKKYK